jgi:hypothetical protein
MNRARLALKAALPAVGLAAMARCSPEIYSTRLMLRGRTLFARRAVTR